MARNEENGQLEVQWNDIDGKSCMYNADGRDIKTSLLHRMSIAYPFCSAASSFDGYELSSKSGNGEYQPALMIFMTGIWIAFTLFVVDMNLCYWWQLKQWF